MPKVEALNNFHHDGRMRAKGEQFETPDADLHQLLELKRVKVVTNAKHNSPVTQNRQLDGGVDKTTVSPPAPPSAARGENSAKVGGNPVPAISTEIGGRDLVANSTAARRATGKAPSTAAPTPASTASSPPKAGKNDDGSASKQ